MSRSWPSKEVGGEACQQRAPRQGGAWDEGSGIRPTGLPGAEQKERSETGAQW